ncbi:MAG: DNA-binding response regulator [Candidatus Aminicenantes bacterium RBG_19FT_COMBO_65_30]|nr:MAG: DNA-binding response regulator [Candidatus Aminicenantes bacterium RBG_19FT_COMBO_65_30]
MKERILVVEDEPTIATGLRDDLELEGFAVEVVDDGTAALSRILEEKFDLVLLDLMLPGMDGLTVCREARSKGRRTPIIILTAKGQEVDKVVGLELGADDYITKPFSRRELLARVKAVLRRGREDPGPGKVYGFADITVDTGRFEVTRRGEKIELTATEFKLLQVFLEHRGRVMSIDELLREVWGRDAILTDRVVYTHINHLRNKLEENPQEPRFLVGVRGVGYRFDG